MSRRVNEGPRDEYERHREDLHRRTDWEHGDGEHPDPDWEGHGGQPHGVLRDLLHALSRRPRDRSPRGRD